MWRDLVDRVEALKANPMVRHLIDTPKHSYGDGSRLPEARDIDRDHHPRDVFAPLSADSSQLAAVMAAAARRGFVLHGPPGTGKSQTIANMIAQCLATGRTVLFVSQKTAALEVVQRRLRDIGLGSYCLEVQSTKAQKSSVLSQLKAAWHDRQPPTGEAWEAATDALAALRDELNRLVASLHRRYDNGLTPHEAFGRVIANRDAWPGLRIGWDGLNQEPARLDRLRVVCRDVETALRAVGTPTTHPLRGLAAQDWTPAWRDALVRGSIPTPWRRPVSQRPGPPSGWRSASRIFRPITSCSRRSPNLVVFSFPKMPVGARHFCCKARRVGVGRCRR